MNKQQYLEEIRRVIDQGPYKADWASLSNHPEPDWYKNGKFGIFIHWGIYSVPAFGNEWYPRHMYLQDQPEFEHHRKTWGEHKDFGYKDFIPLFKAEKFDPEAWMDLFQEAGARYVTPVAEHHDGFQMYKSDLSRFNAGEMGPCRDVVGELKQAADARGIQLCASSHRAEHYWFMNGGRTFDSGMMDDPEYVDFYGPAVYHEDFAMENPDPTHLIESTPPSEEYLQDWLVRTCEIVDRFQPGMVYFDWWIQNLGFKPYLKQFAAYYYNRAAQWGKQVTINYKYNAYAPTVGVYDIERGQLAGINPRLWQNDTSIAKNSWGYTDGNDFKKPVEIICDLVDIVSKNGCLMLNVGPKSDGTITEEEQQVLRAIGKWLKKNGEGIYDTTYWKTYGEGPTEVKEGAFTDTDRASFTSRDIRYTYKAGAIYAFAMKPPADGQVHLGALKRNPRDWDDLKVLSVELLGSGKAEFQRSFEEMTVTLPEIPQGEEPICLKITID